MIGGNLSPLANHLWQSTLIAAAAWLLTLALRKNRAAVRYGVWLAASVKFLIPFSLLARVGGQLEWWPIATAGPVPMPYFAEQISQPFALPVEAVPAATAAASSNSVEALLFGAWFCGFAVSAAVWLRLRWRLRAASRAAMPLDIDVPIPVMISPGRVEPGVLGIRRPILLLPEGILSRLTDAELRSVLAHELCHVRRRDNLTAAIHMSVESIFWFYPLTWWIGARLVEERELACDEEVLRLGNDPHVYASAILNICRFYVRSPLPSAAGVTGADLEKRIDAIVNHRVPRGLTAARKLLLAAAGMAGLAGPVLVGIVNASPRLAQPRADRHALDAAPARSGDFEAGGKAPARMRDLHPRLDGRARIVLAQAKAPPEPRSSSTQRSPFEPVPKPPDAVPPKAAGPIIEAIEFRGARRIPQFALRAIIYSRAGGACDMEALRRDVQALHNTARFSSVALETEPGRKGVIVRFVLVERQVIRSVELQGGDPVTLDEVFERFKQRKIRLGVETLYHEDELGLAAATVRELLAEKGRHGIAVIPSVEPIPPASVKIVFRVEEER